MRPGIIDLGPLAGGGGPEVISAYAHTSSGYQEVEPGDVIISGLAPGTYRLLTTATAISACAWRDNNGLYGHVTGFISVSGRSAGTPESPSAWTAIPALDGAVPDGELVIVVSGAPSSLTGMLSCTLS